MMRKLRWIILFVVLFSIVGPAWGAPPGQFTVDFNIQNLGTSSANIVVNFINPDGSSAGTKTFYNVSAGGSAYFNPALHTLDGGGTLPSGWQGAAIVSADQPVSAIATVANNLSGSQYVSDAYVGIGEPAPVVFAPIVMAKFGPWNTRMAIQNAGALSATVEIQFISGGSVVATQSIPNLPAGASALVDQWDHPTLTNFNGSAIISATQPVAVTVDEYRTTGGLLVSYSALPLSKASTTLYMPGYINAYGSWTTDFTMINTASSPASVQIQFTNNQTLNCSIPANGSLYLNPAANVYGGCTGGPLASNFYGAATVTSTQPLVIAYNIANTLGPGDRAIGYTAFAPSDVGTKMAVPLIENQYSGGKWTTTFSVQVIGGGAAQLTLNYSGNLGTFSRNVTVQDAQTFNQLSDGHIPPGFLGSVTILSDKPIAVIGDQNSLILSGDVAAGFPGVKSP
ncbi:hypothetical protein [Thermoflexus sp.]|uniref:hypothetical protein n=1 Tax=Thermoflexus sp. TaxID=1969742 RepID=UPI0035E458B2